jgi:hypothetical protein
VTKRWTTADGGRIDVIDLTLTNPDAGDRRVTEATGDGQWFRVTGPRGNYRGKYRTPAELTTLGIDLAEMKEVAA